MKLSLQDGNVGGRAVHFLQFDGERVTLQTEVRGILANSIPTSERGKERLLKWKFHIARKICSERGSEKHNPRLIYAMSLGMSFYPPAHGNQQLDVENFVKPIFDGIAAASFAMIVPI